MRITHTRLERAYISLHKAEAGWLSAWMKLSDEEQKEFCEEMSLSWPVELSDFGLG